MLKYFSQLFTISFLINEFSSLSILFTTITPIEFLIIFNRFLISDFHSNFLPLDKNKLNWVIFATFFFYLFHFYPIHFFYNIFALLMYLLNLHIKRDIFILKHPDAINLLLLLLYHKMLLHFIYWIIFLRLKEKSLKYEI